MLFFNVVTLRLIDILGGNKKMFGVFKLRAPSQQNYFERVRILKSLNLNWRAQKTTLKEFELGLGCPEKVSPKCLKHDRKQNGNHDSSFQMNFAGSDSNGWVVSYLFSRDFRTRMPLRLPY